MKKGDVTFNLSMLEDHQQRISRFPVSASYPSRLTLTHSSSAPFCWMTVDKIWLYQYINFFFHSVWVVRTKQILFDALTKFMNLTRKELTCVHMVSTNALSSSMRIKYRYHNFKHLAKSKNIPVSDTCRLCYGVRPEERNWMALSRRGVFKY